MAGEVASTRASSRMQTPLTRSRFSPTGLQANPRMNLSLQSRNSAWFPMATTRLSGNLVRRAQILSFLKANIHYTAKNIYFATSMTKSGLTGATLTAQYSN